MWSSHWLSKVILHTMQCVYCYVLCGFIIFDNKFVSFLTQWFLSATAFHMSKQGWIWAAHFHHSHPLNIHLPSYKKSHRDPPLQAFRNTHTNGYKLHVGLTHSTPTYFPSIVRQLTIRSGLIQCDFHYKLPENRPQTLLCNPPVLVTSHLIIYLSLTCYLPLALHRATPLFKIQCKKN